MYYADLKSLILLEPYINKEADKLCIISGYATPTMSSWHIDALANKRKKLKNIQISLVIGMTKNDGIRKESHTEFLKQVEQYPNFECNYIYRGYAVHSKLYVWLKGDKPIKAYTGSANYTQSGFSNYRRELMTECSSTKAYEYYQSLLPDTLNCLSPEVENKVQIIDTPLTVASTNPQTLLAPIHLQGLPRLDVSLLVTKGDRTGEKSGLNWGHRGNRNRDEAYIPLQKKQADTGFFPRNGEHFIVHTDDSKSMILRTEQANNKAITTPLNNSEIGGYFRQRLGLSSGAFVTKNDLEKYGRTNVTFYKFNEEYYYMDFSV